MAGEDRILMSVKELRRAHLIHQVLEGKLRQGQAAEVMGLSDRQVSADSETGSAGRRPRAGSPEPGAALESGDCRESQSACDGGLRGALRGFWADVGR